MNSLFPMSQLLDAAFRPDPGNGETGGERTWREVPRADILEGDADYVIRMDLPGIKAEDLDISLENQVLTVKAERNREFPEGYQAHRREMPTKVSLRRSFNLGQAVSTESIGAALDEGVLTVTLPKSEQSLPRRIEVR
jgi:HSP20 family protein